MAAPFIGGRFTALGPLGIVPGAFLFSYVAGSLTPQATFTSSSAASPNTNPVVCNAAGQADVWLGPGAYRMILKDAFGATIWDEDNLTGGINGVDLSAAAGSALIGFGATTTYAAGTSGLHMAGMPSVKDAPWNAKGDGATDDTAAIQSAIDSGKSLYFPEGVYAVKKLTFNQNGKTYFFSNAQILAIDTAAQKGVIDWQAAYCRTYSMAVVGNWKTNYSSAIYWHSSTTALPAKSNHHFGLSIDNAVIGILFGELSPTVPVDAPQSENFIFGFKSRGVQQTIYVNQSNGFLEVNGEVAVGKNEWDIQNPGVYSFTNSCIAQVLLGVLRLHGDLEKTDTQLGAGFKNSGGTLEISGNIEVGCQVCALSGGVTHVRDIAGGAWGNAANSWAVLSGAGGVFHVGNFLLNKSAAAAAANTAFVDFGGATGWDVSLTDLRLENQLNLFFNNGNAQPHVMVGNTLQWNNVYSVATAGASVAPYFPRVSSSVINMLDFRGTDTIGNDIATWYKRDLSGTGSIALAADVPSGSGYFNSVSVSPAATTGSSSVNSMDLTSLATVKATGIKCRPGETFKVAGWFRMTTAGSGKIEVLFAGTTGSAQASLYPADNTTCLTTTWQFFKALVVVPASCAYLGLGINGTSGTVCRLVGAKVSKTA